MLNECFQSYLLELALQHGVIWGVVMHSGIDLTKALDSGHRERTFFSRLPRFSRACPACTSAGTYQSSAWCSSSSKAASLCKHCADICERLQSTLTDWRMRERTTCDESNDARQTRPNPTFLQKSSGTVILETYYNVTRKGKDLKPPSHTCSTMLAVVRYTRCSWGTTSLTLRRIGSLRVSDSCHASIQHDEHCNFPSKASSELAG